MKKNLNRRKILFFNKQNISYIFFITLTLIVLLSAYLNKNLLVNTFVNKIEVFSKNFKYQYVNLNISGADKVDPDYLKFKLQKYIETSIFLLPLDDISNEIKENNWIKNIKLSTNYKDTLFVEIEEFKPLGIYSFNNRLFYFDTNGKVIEELNNNSHKKNFVEFFGPASNLKAKLILNILEKLNFQHTYKIKKIEYVKKRRWDIYLIKNIKLMLSENKPEKSLQNFINIEKKLSEVDMNNIESIDLRNISKTLISYKQ